MNPWLQGQTDPEPLRPLEPRQPAQPYPPLGRGHKVFAWVLVALAIVWLYLLLRVLSQALPAVLPGQGVDIPVISPLLEMLPEGAAIEPPAMDSPFNEPITILVLGTDRRPDDSELSVRTDTVLVLRLDPGTNRATAVSFPRDLWVTINAPDGAYEERINASYRAGAEYYGSVEAGAEQVAYDLEWNFGITTDYYILFDIRDAARIIDALSGVDIEVPEELAVPEWFYSDDDATNPVYLSFPPGKHHLDGYHAVAFGRYRDDGNADFGRIQRQQLVLMAMFERIFSWRGWLNPFGLLRAGTDAMHTDIPSARMPGIALLGGRSVDDLALFSLGDAVDGVETVYYLDMGGASVLGWDANNVAIILERAQQTR